MCHHGSTPLLFVMHGVKRDADKYFSKMLKKELPHKFGFTLICPEFSKVRHVSLIKSGKFAPFSQPIITMSFRQENFPSRSGYNSGNVFRKENTKRRNERGDWGFSAIESIFDTYLSITGSRCYTCMYIFNLLLRIVDSNPLCHQSRRLLPLRTFSWCSVRASPSGLHLRGWQSLACHSRSCSECWILH